MLHLCKPHKSVPFFLPCQAQLNDKSFTVQDSQDIELTGVINKADLTLLQIVATFEKQIELKFFRDDVEKNLPPMVLSVKFGLIYYFYIGTSWTSSP